MMEWTQVQEGLLVRSAGLVKITVLETRDGDWRAYASVLTFIVADVEPLSTADEAKAAIVAKVREILEKELEALR